MLKIITKTLCILLALCLQASLVYSENLPDINAESAVLIEFDTGRILYQKNSQILQQPASLTKLMTEYLLLCSLREGRISWEEKIPVSGYAFRISENWRLSDFSLDKEKIYSVKELFEAIAIYSANSASIALAESVSGSEKEFVKEMNMKAAELNLEGAGFYDCTGLSNGNIRLQNNYPSGGNKMSAKAAVGLAYHLIRDYPEILNIASIAVKKFYVNSDKAIMLNNWNWMLPGMQMHYAGLDGLKTGHTNSAGYCFVATAQRKGVRLISVVMKSGSRRTCFSDTEKLLDYGFNNFKREQLIPSGYKISIPVADGRKQSVEVIVKKPINKFMKTSENMNYEYYYELKKPHDPDKNELQAPLKKNQFVGYLKLKQDNSEYMLPQYTGCDKAELFVSEDVEKASFFEKLIMRIRKYINSFKSQRSLTGLDVRKLYAKYHRLSSDFQPQSS